MFLSMQDELATHLVASSASKIAMDLCEKRHPDLNLWKVYIKPEFHSQFFKLMRKNYNFLKHADRDTEDQIEVTNLREINCFEILTTQWHREALFGNVRNWQNLVFFSYIALKYPKWLKLDTFSDQQKNAVKKLQLMCDSENIDEFFEKQLKLILEYRGEIATAVPGLGL